MVRRLAVAYAAFAAVAVAVAYATEWVRAYRADPVDAIHHYGRP